MVRKTVYRSILITVCLLLGLAAFGNAQSGKHKQHRIPVDSQVSPTRPLLLLPSAESR